MESAEPVIEEAIVEEAAAVVQDPPSEVSIANPDEGSNGSKGSNGQGRHKFTYAPLHDETTGEIRLLPLPAQFFQFVMAGRMVPKVHEYRRVTKTRTSLNQSKNEFEEDPNGKKWSLDLKA